ncbi:hypothetical protein GCM10023087_07560 [Microbacterium rhizosphaerae]
MVRGAAGGTAEEVEGLASQLAGQALDLLHSDLGDPLILELDDSPRILVWDENGGRRLRITAIGRASFAISAQVEARDSAGNRIPAPVAPTRTWHPSMRYYRIAEATVDLFDSYRNTYLALESILSDMVPPSTSAGAAKQSWLQRSLKKVRARIGAAPAPVAANRPESESIWLKRALRQVEQVVDLTTFAPPGSKRSAPNAIFDDLYSNFRTATFHAKKDRPVLTPHELTVRKTLIAARVRYANLYRSLAAEHLNSRYGASNLSNAAFRSVLASTVVNPEVYVSEDPTAHTDEPEGEYELAPAGGRYFVFPTPPYIDHSQPDTVVIRGSVAAGAARGGIETVRRFGLIRDGVHAMVESLQAPLDIVDVDHLEVEFIVGARGRGTPRRDFES